MYDKVPEFYNDLLRTYFDEHRCLLDAERNKLDSKYISSNLTHDHNYMTTVNGIKKNHMMKKNFLVYQPCHH